MTTDWRKDHVLKPGDIIETETGNYTITKDILFFGGSAIVYSAVCSRDKLPYVIKEVFPNKPSCYKRRGGVVRAKDPKNEHDRFLLKEACLNLRREQELGNRCFQGTALAVPIREILKPTAVVTGEKRYERVGGISRFAVLDSMSRKNSKRFSELLADIRQERSDAYPLRTGGLPSLYTTLCMIERVLNTLEFVHSQDILFGDISADNIVFGEMKPEKGELGVAYFLDFGCARKLFGSENDKKTAPIAEKTISATKGFCPPELENNKGELQLTPAADIFAVGALLLRALLPESRLDCLGAVPLIGEEVIQYDDEERLGITGDVCRTLNYILYKAMNPDRNLRYQSVAPFWADIRSLINETRQDYSLPRNLAHSSSFIPHSRDAEISIYRNILQQERRCFIYAQGGQGKSEVGVELGLQMPGRCFFIHWHDSMFDTIADLNFSGCNYNPLLGGTPDEVKKRRYKKNLQILMRSEFRDVLLIFDDFYDSRKTLRQLQSEEAYQQVYHNLPSMLAFTTRYDMGRAECELKPLHEDVLVRFMRQWPGCGTIPEQKLRAMIQAVSGNILFVELCAKTISSSWNDITADTILDGISKHRLKSLKAPRISSEKDAAKNGQDSPKELYKHIQTLFKLSSLGRYEKKVLRYLVVNPKQNISAVLLRACLLPREKDALTRLIDSGWIKRTTDNTLILHPLIKLLASEELKPTDAQCAAFLEKLNKACRNLFFISGSVGSGKSTVLRLAMEAQKDIRIVPVVTTRPMHPGEVDGVHYFFTTEEEIQDMAHRDLLLECDQHAQNYYGIPRIPLEEALAEHVVFLELTVEALDRVKSRYPECTTIFIAPPSEDELVARLRGRRYLEDSDITIRMMRAKWEMEKMILFDHVLINDNPLKCAEELLQIVEFTTKN